MRLPTLYDINKRGDIKVWLIETDGDMIYVSYGQQGGKLRVTPTKCAAKNVGKSNETTPEQQAILEAKSKWRQQQDRKGYVQDVEQVGKEFRPMKAQDLCKYPERADKMKTDMIFGQFKLDGVRSFYEENEFLSLRRDPYKVMRWMRCWAEKLVNRIEARVGSTVITDGEFYKHGELRQDINSATKKHNELTDSIEYHVYDFYCPDQPDMTFSERFRHLRAAFMDMPDCPIKFVDSFLLGCLNDKYIDEIVKWCERKGYEGLIIRFDMPYEPSTRSNNMWKAKKFLEGDFIIVDVVEDKPIIAHGREWRQGKFICITKDGKEFGCKPRGHARFREEILLNKEKYIGEIETTKYQGWTRDGRPDFPVGLEVRFDT